MGVFQQEKESSLLKRLQYFLRIEYQLFDRENACGALVVTGSIRTKGHKHFLVSEVTVVIVDFYEHWSGAIHSQIRAYHFP